MSTGNIVFVQELPHGMSQTRKACLSLRLLGFKDKIILRVFTAKWAVAALAASSPSHETQFLVCLQIFNREA